MGAQSLRKQQDKPIFDMPEKYLSDIWDLTQWDYYKNSYKQAQERFISRSNYTQNKVDFTLCNDIALREELKYCMYHYIEIEKVSLITFAEKYDFLKHVIRFLNKNSFTTITQNGVADSWNTYFLTATKNKATTLNGFKVTTDLTKSQKKKRNRAITFFETCINIVTDYHNKDLPAFERDVWNYKDFKTTDKIAPHRNIYFESIKNHHFKTLAKRYALLRLNNTTFAVVAGLIKDVCTFFDWLYSYNPTIKSLLELNRDIIEEYLLWVKTEATCSKSKANENIRLVKQFFDFGAMYDKKNFPETVLFLDSDYNITINKAPNPLTDDEFKEVTRAIKVMPKVYGRFIYVLMLTGMRISELLYLSIDSLEKRENGKYLLVLHQYKTISDYEKPTFEAVQKIIDVQAKRNIEKFGDEAKYVFVDDNNKPFCESTINNQFRTALMKVNARDRNGEPLHCNFHRFRSTIATNYVEATGNIEGASKLLGHKNLSSLNSYLSVKTDTVKKQLKPRLDKDEILINSIGVAEKFDASMFKNLIPLSNGWCSKNPDFGICKKANACIFCDLFVPTPRHLPAYKLQLLNIEATIEAAKVNQMDSILENSLKSKEALERIIAQIEKKLEDNKNGK